MQYEHRTKGIAVHHSAFIILHFRERRAFTLMELLVSLALFAVTTGLIAGLFVAASRRHARATAATRLQADARLITETIARELRDGTIDYDRLPADGIAIRDPAGETVTVVRATTECPTGVTACVRIGRRSAVGQEEWAPLSGAGTEVDAFDVRVAPSADPFTWDASAGHYGADAQPRATVHLTLSRAVRSAIDRVSLEAQTTVVSRMYKR